MITEPNYTDALTDDQCVEICQRLPLGCAGFVSVDAIRYALAPLLTERQAAMQGQGGDVPTIDLDAENWKAIKQAVQESNWIPPEYFANDWVSDVCNFLKGNSDGIQPPQPVRSVSDEDVEDCAKVYDKSWSKALHNRDCMRAALEHFAAIAQERQS